MQTDFRVESRSYDQLIRGSWRAYRLDEDIQLSDELLAEVTGDGTRLWLPAGTLMNWSTGTRPLRYNCLQFFWPQRWYMLSAFYQDRVLRHTYASVIQPATIGLERLSFVDLDLNVLIKPDLTHEVLTMAEFEQMADLLHYSEETRISALMALRTLTSSIQLTRASLHPFRICCVNPISAYRSVRNNEMSTPKRIDHIAIIVRNIESALVFYRDALGIVPGEIQEVPTEQVRIAFLPLGGPGGSEIELIEPTTPDSSLSKFLGKRGEGLHHICLEVEDIDAALAELQAKGTSVLDQQPRSAAEGRAIFIHPKAANGVLLELIQK